MGEPRGAPALALGVLLVLAAVTADEPSSPLDAALSAEGQTPEPVSPAKLEASGESDLTTSAQRLGTGVTSLRFEDPQRSSSADSGARESHGSDSSSLDTLNSGSFGVDTLAGGGQGGPIMDVPAQSESEEGVEHEGDSEEALMSQGV